MTMTGIADILSRASDTVEDFRGDHDQLAAMLRASWAEGVNPPYLYTTELLADYLRYPGAGPALAPAIYDGSEIVAFVAGFPRRVLIDGTQRRVVISALLTVAPAHKSSGYGLIVWNALLRRAADAGFDGVVNYCVDGEAMHRMIETSCRLLELPLVRVKTFSYLVRAIGTPGGSLTPPAGDGEAPAADLIAAAAALSDQCDVCRLWTEPEADWQLSRYGAVSVRARTETGPALLTGSVLTVDDDDRTPYLVIDDVLWGGLDGEGRVGLVKALVDDAARQGARYAALPLLGYSDLRPFMAAGFLPSPHTMHAYLSLWRAPDEVVATPRYYLDVI
jgi:hypothetical protein